MYESVDLYRECDGESVPDTDQYVNSDSVMQRECIQLCPYEFGHWHCFQLDAGGSCGYQQCLWQRSGQSERDACQHDYLPGNGDVCLFTERQWMQQSEYLQCTGDSQSGDEPEQHADTTGHLQRQCV